MTCSAAARRALSNDVRQHTVAALKYASFGKAEWGWLCYVVSHFLVSKSKSKHDSSAGFMSKLKLYWKTVRYYCVWKTLWVCLNGLKDHQQQYYAGQFNKAPHDVH